MRENNAMASPRWPAVLHEGESSQPLEVSADTHTLILHVGPKAKRWPFRDMRFRSGGIPRFEYGESLLIVTDPAIVHSIEMLNPAAVSEMEKAASTFTGRDFCTALIAVLIVMGGASAIAAVIWFTRH
jgi:hypothetical protein